MQIKRLIRNRGPCLAVVAVLLFTGLLMAACLLDESGNGEGQGTLLAPLGGTPKNAPPVANNPPAGQPVVGNPPVTDDPPVTGNPPAETSVVDNPPETKSPSVPFDPSLPEGDRYHDVLIVFTNEASLQFLTYEAKDFPEVNCVYIYSNVNLTRETAKAQYEAERTGVWSAELLERKIRLNFNTYKYMIHLIILEESKESFMRGIGLLGQRKDIYHMEVYPEWVESGPVYGAFKDRGLDVQTEKQILQDWAVKDVRADIRQYYLTFPNSNFISYYGGTYNGSVVVVFNGAMERHSFYFDDAISIFSFTPFVWNNGSFYYLGEAYRLGLLTDDEIRGLPELQITVDEKYWLGDMLNCCYAHLDKKAMTIRDHEHDFDGGSVSLDNYWNPMEENYEH